MSLVKGNKAFERIEYTLCTVDRKIRRWDAVVLSQVAQCKGQISDLEAAKGELANQNTQYQVKIPSRETEKAKLTDRNEENKSQIQTLSKLIRMNRSV